MKFCSSIKNLSALLVVMVLCTGVVSAQSNFNSTYSRFGLGLLEQPGTTTHFGMGGLTSPVADAHVINFANPGTYSFLETTMLQVTGKGGIVDTHTETESAQNIDGTVSGLGLAFKKPYSKWAFVMGLAPYSSVNYSFGSKQTLNDSTNAKYTYSGKGGLNIATLGSSRAFQFYSYRANRDTACVKDSLMKIGHQLSIGVNMNYLFGSIERTTLIDYQNTGYFNTRRTSNLFAQGFIFDLGAFYRVALKSYCDKGRWLPKLQLQAGAVYSFNSDLRARYNDVGELWAYNSYGLIMPLDTAYRISEETGRMKLPGKISVGAAIRRISRRSGSIVLGVDYKMQNWKNYKLTLPTDAGTANNLNASYTMSVGFEYKPSTSASTDLFHRMAYRLGARNTDTYLIFGDQKIVQQAISAGLSIPIVRTDSKFHIGAEYGTNGTTSSGLIQEDFINFMVGFSLTPRETWFFQRKYD